MLENFGVETKWVEEVAGESWSLWDGCCRARVQKIRNGWWIGDVFRANPSCAGSHQMRLDDAKVACERLWAQTKERVLREEACPKSYDKEVAGIYPRVYCARGCGCWAYASPSPTHLGCSSLCNSHPSPSCTTFQCTSPGCFGAFIRDHRKKSLAAETKSCDACKVEYPTANMTDDERCNDFWRCKKCELALFSMLDEIDDKARLT